MGIRVSVPGAVCLVMCAGAMAADDGLPRGEATLVSAADVAAVNATLGDRPNIDKVVRTVATARSAGNISIATVAYANRPQEWDGTANEHDRITEVFHVTQGSATFVLGGDLENPKPFDVTSDAVKKVFGPGRGGKALRYQVVKVAAGDNLVLPPNTPHNIVEVADDFRMLVIRIDPDRVIEAGPVPAPAAVDSAVGPWLGKWRQKGAPAGAVFTMWQEGDGFRYTYEAPRPGGEPVRMEAFGRFDGRPYPERGNPAADFNVFRRVDDRTYALVDIKDGEEKIHFNITISPDGKTRTSVSTRLDAAGREVSSTGVWERVE